MANSANNLELTRREKYLIEWALLNLMTDIKLNQETYDEVADLRKEFLELPNTPPAVNAQEVEYTDRPEVQLDHTQIETLFKAIDLAYTRALIENTRSTAYDMFKHIEGIFYLICDLLPKEIRIKWHEDLSKRNH